MGKVLFEAPGSLPDGTQTCRAGFPLWKREQFVLQAVFAHPGQRSNVRLSWEFARDSLESL